MTNDYQEIFSGRLLDQLEYPGALLTEEEVSYFRGCGFDNTRSMPPARSEERPAKKRGRPGKKLRRFFFSIGTSPQPVEELCQQYGVSENTVRQAQRFDRYPDRGRVRTKTVDGVLVIWRQSREQIPMSSAGLNID